MPPCYIALDVEAAGGKLGHHSTLSLGACVVRPEPLSFEQASEKGLVFYAELKPEYMRNWDIDAMRVGCSHLVCLEELRKEDPRYDSKSPAFDCLLVLNHMKDVCESGPDAIARLEAWIDTVARGRDVIGVTDTVFFDSGHFNLCFGLYSRKLGISPFGWGGLDMASLYKGYSRQPYARLKDLGIKDDRAKPHRADHDAAYQARIASKLIFEKMSW